MPVACQVFDVKHWTVLGAGPNPAPAVGRAGLQQRPLAAKQQPSLAQGAQGVGATEVVRPRLTWLPEAEGTDKRREPRSRSATNFVRAAGSIF